MILQDLPGPDEYRGCLEDRRYLEDSNPQVPPEIQILMNCNGKEAYTLKRLTWYDNSVHTKDCFYYQLLLKTDLFDANLF